MKELRYKKTLPFSQRLNDWIIERAERVNYYPVHTDVPPEVLVQFKGQRFPVSSLYCEKTVFGDPDINVMFRAWHDDVHLTNDYGFDLNGEVLTAFKQASELPIDWHYERELILIEVIAQVQYALSTGGFVDDQRRFNIDVRKKGL